MSQLLNDIGWAAGRVYGHARLTSIERDDLQGSAAVDERDDEELEKNPDIVDEDDRLDDDDLDDQPRGKRSDKSARAYDELKSERDRLKAETEKKDRLLQDATTRLQQLEQRETRDAVNVRVDAAQAEDERMAREFSAQLKSVDRNDPEYTEKVTKLWLQKQREVAREASLRTSSEVVETRLTEGEFRKKVRAEAVDELKRQGLTEEDYDLLLAINHAQGIRDPGWDKRMPNEQQIPHLVGILKERLVKTTRQSPTFRDEKERHRRDMGGVIGEGSRSGERRRQTDTNEGKSELGSSIDDLTRLRTLQKQSASRMLRMDQR